MARFGSQVLGVEFVAMCRALAETAIISATLGMAALGYLNIAQRIVQIVQDLTGAALLPVSTVAFSRDPRLRRAPARRIRARAADDLRGHVAAADRGGGGRAAHHPDRLR